MFYEERCIDGVWYWRGAPDGEWNEFTVSDLRNKLSEETKRADDAEAQRDKATELLREMGYGFGRGDYPADFMMPGDVRYELLEALDAALAEMEKHDG